MLCKYIIAHLIVFSLFISQISGEVYKVGDIVENLTWEDSNIDSNGNIKKYNRSLNEIIESNKVVILDFSSDG